MESTDFIGKSNPFLIHLEILDIHPFKIHGFLQVQSDEPFGSINGCSTPFHLNGNDGRNHLRIWDIVLDAGKHQKGSGYNQYKTFHFHQSGFANYK